MDKIRAIIAGSVLALTAALITAAGIIFPLQPGGDIGYSGNVAQPYTITAQSGTAATTTEQFGDIIPQVTNVYSLGRSTKQWKDLFLSGTLSAGTVSSTRYLAATGTAALPSFSFINDANTGVYDSAADTLGFSAAGAEVGTWSATALSLTNGQNLVFSGANAINEGDIQFQGAASASYDSNLIYLSNNNMTMGLIGGSIAAFSAANGPFVALRGNTFTAAATQRGLLSFAAGNPSVPATGEGEIRFATGADVQRMVIDKAGVVYIPTPTTNRFVVGGTAALGSGGTIATIIGNTAGVGVLAIQNTTAANAGYAQVDFYNSSGTNVAGFGYGNSATIAATQDRLYFFTVAKDFHISTDSNTTRQFVVAATSGAVSIATKATSGGVAGFTYTPGAHTAVTANITDFKVAAHTMTITGGYASQIFSSFGAPIVTAASGLTLTNVANVNIEMASVAGSALITSNSALFLGSPAAAVTVKNASGTHLSLLETGNQSYTLTAATQITSTIGVAGASFGAMTVNQSGGAVTVDNVATLYIEGKLTAGASVTLTNNYALWVDEGPSRFDGAIIANQATAIASATTIVIPTDGNTFELTGTTAVTLITKTGYKNGHEITLVANENVTITNGTATSGSDVTIKLAGAANFAMTADDTLTLKLTTTTAGGQAWREQSRSAN